MSTQHMNQLQQITGPQYFGTSKKKSCIQDGDKTLPGPGAHTPIPMSKIAIPQWKIGDSKNRDGFLDPHRAKYPSPQDYRVNHHIIQKISKKAIIPQSVYKPKPTNDNLSGFHQVNTTFTKTTYPEFSFAYSQDNNYSTFVPGPGSYELPNKTISFNKTQSGFSTGQRPLPYGQEGKFPGPGKYSTIAFTQTTKYSFGKAQRQRCESNDPPSRFYDLQPKKPVVKLGRGSSTQYRRQTTFLTPNQYPAPGTYNHQIPHKIPNGIIQVSNRKPIQYTQIVKYPSPDKYAAHQDFNRGMTFYKQKRHLQANRNGVPGPGAYEPIPTLSKIGSSFPKQQDLENKKLVPPGASTYQPKDEVTRRKMNSTLVLRSNRTDFSKTITGIIGPGQYNIHKQSQGQLGKISKSPRAQIHSPNKTPGVGNYNIPAFIGQLPKYCTSPKKLTQLGFSTFHQKLKHRLQQKQRKQKSERSQKGSQKQSISLQANPQQLKKE